MKPYGHIFGDIPIVGSDYIAKGDDNIEISIQCHGEPKLVRRFRMWLDERPLLYHYHDYVFTIFLSAGWSERMILNQVSDIKRELCL